MVTQVKRKAKKVIKTNVTWAQLLGTSVTLLILILTSYINLQIRVSQSEVRQVGTDVSVTEIKNSIKDVQATQNIILQKLGGLEVKVEDVQRTNNNKR